MTKTTPKAKKTDATVTTPNQGVFLQVLTELKPQVDEIGHACLQIKVADESTLSIAQQNLSKVNAIIKSIEEKHAEAKRPILDAGKLMDSTKKSLLEVAEKGKAHIKTEIEAWERKRKEEEAKKQAEIEAKAAEQAAKIQAEEERKKGIMDYINGQLVPYLQGTYEALKSVEDCDNFLTYIKAKFPGAEKFQEYLDEALKIKETYIKLIQNKKEQLLTAGTLSEAQAKLMAEKEAMAKLEQELAAKQLALKAAEEQARLEKERQETEEKAQTELLKAQAEADGNKTKGVRYKWDWEVYSEIEVPDRWKSPDPKKIDAYLDECKDKLADGQKLNGVRFFKKMIISS